MTPASSHHHHHHQHPPTNQLLWMHAQYLSSSPASDNNKRPYTSSTQRVLGAPLQHQSTSLRYLKPIVLLLQQNDDFSYYSPQQESAAENASASASGSSSSRGRHAASSAVNASGRKRTIAVSSHQHRPRSASASRSKSYSSTNNNNNNKRLLNHNASASSLFRSSNATASNASASSSSSSSAIDNHQVKKRQRSAVKQLLALWEFLLQRMRMVHKDFHLMSSQLGLGGAKDSSSLSTNSEKVSSSTSGTTSSAENRGSTADGSAADSSSTSTNNNNNSQVAPPSEIEQRLMLHIFVCLMRRREFLREMQWEQTRCSTLDQHSVAAKHASAQNDASHTEDADSLDVSQVKTTTTPRNVQTKPNPTSHSTKPTTASDKTTSQQQSSSTSSSPFSNISSFLKSQLSSAVGKGSSASSTASLLLKKRSKKPSTLSVYANLLFETLLLAIYFLNRHRHPSSLSQSTSSLPAAASSQQQKADHEKNSSASTKIQPALTEEEERFCACTLAICCLKIFSKDTFTSLVDAICVVTLRRKPPSSRSHHKTKRHHRHYKRRHQSKSSEEPAKAKAPQSETSVTLSPFTEDSTESSNNSASTMESSDDSQPGIPSSPDYDPVIPPSASSEDEASDTQVTEDDNDELTSSLNDSSGKSHSPPSIAAAVQPEKSTFSVTASAEASPPVDTPTVEAAAKHPSSNSSRRRHHSSSTRQQHHRLSTRSSVERNISRRLLPQQNSSSSSKSTLPSNQSSFSSSSGASSSKTSSAKKEKRRKLSEPPLLEPIRKASLPRDVKGLIASNLPSFEKQPCYDQLLPQLPLTPPQILHLQNVLKSRHDFLPATSNFFFHFLGQFSEQIAALDLEYKHVRRYLNLIRVYAALTLEESIEGRHQHKSSETTWNNLSTLLLQNKSMVNLLLDIELCRTNAYSVDAVFMTLDRTEAWIHAASQAGTLRSDLILKAVNAGLTTDHFRISSKMLVFLYNIFDHLHFSVRQVVMESLLKQWGLQLLCHWHDDVRICFVRLLIYKLLWKPNSPSVSSSQDDDSHEDEDRVTVSLKSKAETYLYVLKLYHEKILRSTGKGQQFEQRLPIDMRLNANQKGYVSKAMKDVQDIQKEYTKWKQGVYLPYYKRWMDKLQRMESTNAHVPKIPFPTIRIPKFSLRDM